MLSLHTVLIWVEFTHNDTLVAGGKVPHLNRDLNFIQIDLLKLWDCIWFVCSLYINVSSNKKSTDKYSILINDSHAEIFMGFFQYLLMSATWNASKKPRWLIGGIEGTQVDGHILFLYIYKK